MTTEIIPSRLIGTIDAVSSKSDAHRAIICAAFSDAPCEICLNTVSADIEATAAAVAALGASVERTSAGYSVVPAEINAARNAVINCGESGSTLRFLLPVAAAVCKEVSFVGGGRLPERPNAELTARMREHGCTVSADTLPIEVKGKLFGGLFSVRGDISSQYISGLLLALPLMGGGEIEVTGKLESSSYVDMTIDTMRLFGVQVIKRNNRFAVGAESVYRSPKNYMTEGDWSNGAFWLAADFLGSEIKIKGLSPSSLQGDKRVMTILESFNGNGEVTVNAAEIPDLVPVLAVAACGRRGRTVFTECERLRFKESDRMTSTVNMIKALGGAAGCGETSITVIGVGRLTGGEVDCAGDHRIAMSAAVASVICDQKVRITGAEAVGKSYPRFFEDFRMLGGMTDAVGIRK